jgi:hypothetical protein
MTCEEPAADNKWENPPYKIQNFDNTGMRENRQASLGWKTIAPSARECADLELSCYCSSCWQNTAATTGVAQDVCSDPDIPRTAQEGGGVGSPLD